MWVGADIRAQMQRYFVYFFVSVILVRGVFVVVIARVDHFLHTVVGCQRCQVDFGFGFDRFFRFFFSFSISSGGGIAVG